MKNVEKEYCKMGPRDYEYSQDDLDNHANQLNPNNDEYWNSRGM
jgi:hypothetical protein